MRHLIAVLLLLFVVGCAAPMGPSTGTASSGKDNTLAKLIPYESHLLGVRLSYPEGFDKPEETELGIPTLSLRFSTGEFSVLRLPRTPGKTLQEIAKEHIDSNNKASMGRIKSTDLGKEQLGGTDAWAVQSYFDSRAGRWDGIVHIVLTDSNQYVISCRTKQGPPPIPWDSIKPLCEEIITTIQFDRP